MPILRCASGYSSQDTQASLKRLDERLERLSAALRTERAAPFLDLQSEREAVIAAVDVQREPLATDAARIADQVVKSSREQAAHVARELVLPLILVAIVVLGLPFAAGYLVGRARHGGTQRVRER